MYGRLICIGYIRDVCPLLRVHIKGPCNYPKLQGQLRGFAGLGGLEGGLRGA